MTRRRELPSQALTERSTVTVQDANTLGGPHELDKDHVRDVEVVVFQY